MIQLLQSRSICALCAFLWLGLCLLCGPAGIRAQTKDKWQRVYTGEDSVIEINVSSLRFEADHILRVQFRTILSKPETITGNPGAKYKSRLETIDFKLNERRYRPIEIMLLDSNGKQLQSYTLTSEDWRVLKNGGVTERMLGAALGLPPFGSWTVETYRYAEGNSREVKPARELEKLIGTRVHLYLARAEVGTELCNSFSLQNRQYTKDELFQTFGIQLNSIGVNADSVETINVICDGGGWQPPRSLLIKVDEDEMLMLWQGVFLALKRDRG